MDLKTSTDGAEMLDYLKENNICNKRTIAKMECKCVELCKHLFEDTRSNGWLKLGYNFARHQKNESDLEKITANRWKINRKQTYADRAVWGILEHREAPRFVVLNVAWALAEIKAHTETMDFNFDNYDCECCAQTAYDKKFYTIKKAEEKRVLRQCADIIRKYL